MAHLFRLTATALVLGIALPQGSYAQEEAPWNQKREVEVR